MDSECRNMAEQKSFQLETREIKTKKRDMKINKTGTYMLVRLYANPFQQQ